GVEVDRADRQADQRHPVTRVQHVALGARGPGKRRRHCDGAQSQARPRARPTKKWKTVSREKAREGKEIWSARRFDRIVERSRRSRRHRFKSPSPASRSALNGELRKNSGANAPTQGRKPP